MTDTQTVLDVRQILRYLPHRYPFLLIDRVLDYVPGKSLTAVKNVTINEPFFQGHFPGHPVMPGVLIVEAMAQATGVLAFVSGLVRSDARCVYYFVGIDKARFKRPVTPGDRMLIEVILTRSLRGVWRFSAEATVEGAVVSQAELMTTIKEIEP
jgi:3-hydroxyacyl-[acyl-carrier-protein] dehydratase